MAQNLRQGPLLDRVDKKKTNKCSYWYIIVSSKRNVKMDSIKLIS